MAAEPWWKNSRGELFVIAQSALFALIIFGPRTLSCLPEWNRSAQVAGKFAGGSLLFCGTMLAAAGTLQLGRNLTPFITPKDAAVLLDQGAYRLVRHPIYSGILQLAFGWGFWVQGWLSLVYAITLLFVFDCKLRREEVILQRTFADYTAYAARVRRLIPFIY